MVAEEKQNTDKVARRKGLGAGLALLTAAFLVGTILQHLSARTGFSLDSTRATGAALGTGAFALTLLSGLRRGTRRFLASNRFSVPCLVVFTVLSILGTLILQTTHGPTLQQAYGESLPVLRAFFLNDLFHGFGFAVLCGLGAGGLMLVILRRRRMNIRYAGAVGAHLGIVLLLAGAAVGNLWGVRGRLDMQEGQRADTFRVAAEDGRFVPARLGFTLALEDFELEEYQPDYRLMLFDVADGGERRLFMVDPAAPDEEELSQHGIRVLGYWPDYVQTAKMEVPADGAQGSPALELTDGRFVLDTGGPEGGQLVTRSGAGLVFFQDADRATAFTRRLEAAGASPHRIQAGENQITLEPGRDTPLPGTGLKIRIERAFTDFVLDTKSRRPVNRSDRPDNPAVEVVITGEDGEEVERTWLFALFPDFHGRRQDSVAASLKYRYQTGSTAAVVVVGGTRQVWRLEMGVVQETLPIPDDGRFEVGGEPVRVKAIHPRARRVFEDHTRSADPVNPVIRVQVQGDQPRLLGAKRPARLSGQKALVLAPKGGDTARDYLSTVSVYEQGRKVRTEVVEVNHPLQHGGFAIYQADFRPDDPTYSGFEVVSDPGIWIVYLGLLTNALGVSCVLLVWPLVRRRRANSTREVAS
jgi:hypothetical protein